MYISAGNSKNTVIIGGAPGAVKTHQATLQQTEMSSVGPKSIIRSTLLQPQLHLFLGEKKNVFGF